MKDFAYPPIFNPLHDERKSITVRGTGRLCLESYSYLHSELKPVPAALELLLACGFCRFRSNSQVNEDFRVWVIGGEQVVTRGTILGDILAGIGGRMRSVMAAKAAGEIRVPDVIGVGSPKHLHFREHVAIVNCHQRIAGLNHVGALLA